jgi:hypothetical protein
MYSLVRILIRDVERRIHVVVTCTGAVGGVEFIGRSMLAFACIHKNTLVPGCCLVHVDIR